MNIDICTRIEGHAQIEYIVTKDEIDAVNFKMELGRGFEQILEGKYLVDVPRIVSRVCGLCHGSQGIASTLAVENMKGITPTSLATAIREIILCVELIKSHGLHLFFQGYPDVSAYLLGKHVGLEDLVKKDSPLAARMFETFKLAKDAIEIFAGREVHGIKFMNETASILPQQRELSQGKKLMERVKANLEPVLDRLVDAFQGKEANDNFALKNAVAMISVPVETTVPLVSRQGTGVSAKFPNGIVKKVTASDYGKFIYAEDGMREYETTLDAAMRFITGPAARVSHRGFMPFQGENRDVMNIIKAWKDNTLTNYLYQIHEMLDATRHAIALIEALPQFPRDDGGIDDTLSRTEGIGIVEAPRGILLHHYISRDKKVLDKASLLIPTRINTPVIDSMLTRRCKELQGKGYAIDEIKKHAQAIVRTFDPCVACATHVIRTR
nr:nickel-dependent hydrogenase large subunit [Candidatus Sigynarchaeota archaeon]